MLITDARRTEIQDLALRIDEALARQEQIQTLRRDAEEDQVKAAEEMKATRARILVGPCDHPPFARSRVLTGFCHLCDQEIE